MAMTDTQLKTCTRNCATGLRSDYQHGAIYGPYIVEEEDGSETFVSSLEFAGYSGRCVYCGSALPRGRASRILAIVENRRQQRGVQP